MGGEGAGAGSGPVAYAHWQVCVAPWALEDGTVTPCSCLAQRCSCSARRCSCSLDRLRWSAPPSGVEGVFLRLSPGALRDSGTISVMPSALGAGRGGGGRTAQGLCLLL